MADYLLEIGCEEIPATMVAKGVEDLGAALVERLRAEGLAPGGYRGFGGPRRLAVVVSDVPVRQPDRRELVVGPPVAAAIASDGQPTKAAIGFAKRFGVTPADLVQEETPRGMCLAYRLEQAGRNAQEVMSEVVPKAILGLSFGKMMRWGAGEVRFVRAIRSLVSLYDSEVVPFVIAGVSAGRVSFGHRFLGARAITLARVSDYADALAGEHVEVDAARRVASIEAGMREEARRLDADIATDPDLLDEVAFLVENPCVFRGSFAAEFLSLPEEVLITSMKRHQKSFPLRRRDGQLLPNFLAVANVPDVDGHVRRGYERVLRARLADARFFWEADRKVELASRVPSLDRLVFQEKLGSYGSKCRRLAPLAAAVASHFGLTDDVAATAKAAAAVAKADLGTQMVGEFPELQGVTGGLYLAAEGQSPDVARAVYGHYLPMSFEGPLPDSPAGAVLSIADKLDTLVGCFGIGLVPSGTRDPLGLRRAAQGVVRIVLARGLRGDLSPLLTAAAELHAQEPGASAAATGLPSLRDYLRDRVEFALRERHHRADTVAAVLVASPLDFIDVAERAEVLDAARIEPEFDAALTVFKRVANIAGLGGDPAFERGSLKLPEERALAAALGDASDPSTAASGVARWRDTIARLRRLAGPLHEFFDKVLVMDEDPAVRENRLRLLRAIGGIAARMGDLGKLQVEREQGEPR